MFFSLLPVTNSPQLVLSVGFGAMASPTVEIEIHYSVQSFLPAGLLNYKKVRML
jgi:hypothetical protein